MQLQESVEVSYEAPDPNYLIYQRLAHRNKLRNTDPAMAKLFI